MALKILAVDDSATMRQIMEMTFAGEQAEVTTAASGEDALTQARQLRPDLVFADLSMSPMDGYELAKALKSELGNVAVIVMDSQHAPYDADKGKAAGVDDHVAKPFDSQAVIDKVAQVLAKPRAKLGAAAAAAAAPTTSGSPMQGGLGGRSPKRTMAFGSPPPRPAAPKPAAPKPVLELADDALISADKPAPVRTSKATFSRPPSTSTPQAKPPAPKPAPKPLAPKPTFAASPAKPAAPKPAPRPAPAAPKPAPVVAKPEPKPEPEAPKAAPATVSEARPAPGDQPAAAAVAAAGDAMAAKLGDLGLTKEQAEGVLALSREVIEQVVWEVVPELAETLIREEIKRLTES